MLYIFFYFILQKLTTFVDKLLLGKKTNAFIIELGKNCKTVDRNERVKYMVELLNKYPDFLSDYLVKQSGKNKRIGEKTITKFY